MKNDRFETEKRIISSLHSGITDAEFERRKCEVMDELGL